MVASGISLVVVKHSNIYLGFERFKINCPVKKMRTLQERLKIVEEVEKDPTKKHVDVAKRLGIATSTLNSI